MPHPRRLRESERGQASVELAAALPLLALALALAWQAVLAGHTLWVASAAARTAARAAAVGADATHAARTALPSGLRRGVRVATATSGEVSVRVHLPSVLSVLNLGSITARAHFAPQT